MKITLARAKKAREGHHIKLNGCFNKTIEGRTDKEYRDDIVEREKERHKEVKARVDAVVEWYTTRKISHRETAKKLINDLMNDNKRSVTFAKKMRRQLGVMVAKNLKLKLTEYLISQQ